MRTPHPRRSCILYDESLHQALSHSLILAVAEQVRCLRIPFSHLAISVDAKDGCISCVNETRKVVCNPLYVAIT